MLDSIIKKLAIVLVLCGGIACLLYFTDLGALLNGEVEKNVELKEEDKEQIKEEVKKVEEKIEDNVEKIEEKVDELKKIKIKDIIK